MARILVVDDEPDERFLVGRTLRKQGHDVTVAENGAAGLKEAQEQVPDLVVTDVMMPVMDGVEFIRRLRGDPATAGIPILAASGDTHLAGAADAVLAKPYDDDRLVTVVNSLLEKGREVR
ncbi:MAG: response regulator [Streptosporangiaceae bacterium]